MPYHYWDKITLGTTTLMGVERYNILTQTLFTDDQMLSSKYIRDMDEASEGAKWHERLRWFLKVYFSKPGVTEKIISAINTIPLVFELLVKSIAVGITDLYVGCRENFKKSTGWAKFGWGALAVVTGACNALIAQPLIFIANTLSHVRTVIDGTLNFVLGIFSGDTKQAARGLQAFRRGFISLVLDCLVAGAAVACTFIPGAQPAIPFILKAGVFLQSLVVSAVSAGSIAVQTAARDVVRRKYPNNTENKAVDEPGARSPRPAVGVVQSPRPGPHGAGTPEIMSGLQPVGEDKQVSPVGADLGSQHAMTKPVSIPRSRKDSTSSLRAISSVASVVGSMPGSVTGGVLTHQKDHVNDDLRPPSYNS